MPNRDSVIWTQPSGPLCLWQCFLYIHLWDVIKCCPVLFWNLPCKCSPLPQPRLSPFPHPEKELSCIVVIFKLQLNCPVCQVSTYMTNMVTYSSILAKEIIPCLEDCFNFEKQACAMKDFRGRVDSAFCFQHHLLVFLMNCIQKRCKRMFSLKKDVLLGRHLPGREPLSPCPAH